MNGSCRCLFLALFSVLVFLVVQGSAHTDNLDVKALQDLYGSFNAPPQLMGWKSSGGDPCEESWTGISCSGSSVIQIKLDNLNINGNLGYQLNNLRHLRQLDISNNSIYGEIPYSLPMNLTYLNLAYNNLSQYIPYSISSMKNLRHMNLSHNFLSGPVGNVFTGLTYLKEMDLSYNQLIGDLPSSFGPLKGLTKLFLQHNEFTGSVIYLAVLRLTDLNIQDNHFSGIIPKQFQYIHNLWFGGNMFDKGENGQPWDFPLNNPYNEQNITAPPSTESSAVKTYPLPESRLEPREENSLVNWASSRLHDSESLDEMIEPALKKAIPPKALSRFADIISLCTQAKKGFRPSISEVMELLSHVLEDCRRMRTAADNDFDTYERSFRSTNSCFLGSPTVSYMSI